VPILLQILLYSFNGPVIPPSELLDLATQAATLGDIKQARNEAAREAERRERQEEAECEI